MPVPGLSELDSALRMATRDMPVAQLLRAGQRELERGRPEAAIDAFTAALSLDPGNKEAAAGAREAARQIKEKAEAEQQRAVPPPPRPSVTEELRVSRSPPAPGPRLPTPGCARRSASW